MPTSKVSLALAVAVLAAASGCDVISSARNVAANVQTLSEMADQLKDSSELTYTARYVNSAGQKVTLTQDPPKSAYSGPNGTYIATSDSTLLCQRAAGLMTCQKAPATGGAAAITDAATLSAVTGQGFAPPSLAIALLAAAALYPDSKVASTSKSIAGQESKCATATGFADPQSDTAPPVQDFTICITSDGVLSSFEGTLQNGSAGGVRLTSYAKTAAASAFATPAGAKIVDVGQLSPK